MIDFEQEICGYDKFLDLLEEVFNIFGPDQSFFSRELISGYDYEENDKILTLYVSYDYLYYRLYDEIANNCPKRGMEFDIYEELPEQGILKIKSVYFGL